MRDRSVADNALSVPDNEPLSGEDRRVAESFESRNGLFALDKKLRNIVRDRDLVLKGPGQ